MDFSHRPVLLGECMTALAIEPHGIYVDGTAGGGGHSEEMAKAIKTGRLIAIDQDPDAVKAVTARLSAYAIATVYQSNFSDIKNVLTELKIDSVNGVLLDIGVSSHQLDTAERGFSFHNDAPLDMRMSQSGFSARDLVNTFDAQALAKIFFEYGEEKFARNIARAVVRERKIAPIETTGRLSEIIKSAVPAAVRREGGHPARKTFQAIRIAVNGELDHLKAGLLHAFDCLKKDGRLAVITFHSLEDRIVKQQFAKWCSGCVCPPDFPVCICGQTPKGRLVTKKPVQASEQEIMENPRSRSAKLRTIIKL